MKITRPRIIGATMALSAAAALLPAAAAVAFISPPLVLLAEAQSPATLVAKGAAIDVPVEYSCTARSMYVSVVVTERVDGSTTWGSGFTDVPCDGATHRILLRVTAGPGERAFQAGVASTRTDVDGCYVRDDHWVCGTDSVVRTIRIAR